MVKAEFWRDLASRFRAIPSDHGMFRVDYEKVGNRTIWKPHATVPTHNEFKPLAMRAGRALNPKSTDFLLTWLSALWEACPNIQESRFDEQGQAVIRGSILNICQASAEHCNTLQGKAIQGGEVRLPGLSGNDPENFLSREARLRIQDARLYSEQIRWEAESEILLENLDDDHPKAVKLRNKAHVKAAETVLAVYQKEYKDAGLSADEIREVMDDEIEAAVNSLDLDGAQKHILSLKYASDRSTETSVKPVATKPKKLQIPPPPKTPPAETIGEQIKRLREECHWTIEELAEIVDVHERTVSRHELGEVIPYGRTLSIYERKFSKRLERKVVINKMP